MVDAAVACQQMGLVVHPNTWWGDVNIPGSEGLPILRSNVQCTSLDMELIGCVGDDQYEHSCNHTQDVYLRCTVPTWAGKNSSSSSSFLSSSSFSSSYSSSSSTF